MDLSSCLLMARLARVVSPLPAMTREAMSLRAKRSNLLCRSHAEPLCVDLKARTCAKDHLVIGIDRFFCDSVWPCLYRKELFLNLPIYSNLGSLPRWVRNLKNRRFCKKLARTTFLRFFQKTGAKLDLSSKNKIA